MVLICIEGPSKSGKSTLAEKIHEATGIPIWRRPKEIQEFKEKTSSWDLFVLDELSILNSINWKHNDLIVDRHPAVSEWVYAEIYGRKSLVPWFRISLIPEDAIFIFLLEDLGLLVERGNQKEKAAKELRTYFEIAQCLSPHRRSITFLHPQKLGELLLTSCLKLIKESRGQ